MDRFSIFPIRSYDTWMIYKKQIKSFWTVEEIDFSQDYKDFITLDDDKKHSIKMVLSFFANSDGLVNFNIQNNFLNDFDNETTYTYVYQMFIEQIHNETYSIMIDTLIKDEEEKEILFDSINNNKTIMEISNWGIKYSSQSCYTLSVKLLVFICFEGIMFSGAFAFIFWIKKYCSGGKMFMSGLMKSNEFISRDEGMHVDFGVEVFKKQDLKDKTPNYIKTQIILEAVSLTHQFNKDVLRTRQCGMNEELMNKYTEYIADRIFVSIGMKKYFNTPNPLLFMETIGLPQKTNFHESRPTEYQRADIHNVEMEISEEF